MGETFSIDDAKISEYGGVKINKAQIVKTFDEELMQLKRSELKEFEDKKKAGGIRPIKVKPQFARFAGFYLDQFCLYLQKATGTTSESTSLSNNEEKIKEMWGKLMFSACRCMTPELLQVANCLFSVLTAFQYHNKNYYELFVLRKLEFEPLISELNERFKALHSAHIMDHLKAGKGLDTIRLISAESLIDKLDCGSLDGAIKVFSKTQVHLLRIMSQEFIFHHIVQNV